MGLGNQWVPVGSRLRDQSVSREVFRSGLGLRGLLVWGAKLVWVVRLVWVARGIGEGVHMVQPPRWSGAGNWSDALSRHPPIGLKAVFA